MAYKKIPLEEQLEKAGRERIHPEYDACAVQAFGNMQLSDYMKNDNCRTRLAMIYEVLLTPAGPGPADGRYMCGMVRAANTEQVLPDEVLSDNAYYYHAGTGEIEIFS